MEDYQRKALEDLAELLWKREHDQRGYGIEMPDFVKKIYFKRAIEVIEFIGNNDNLDNLFPMRLLYDGNERYGKFEIKI